MIIELNTSSDTPIYVQLRNQIVLGIGRGELKEGEGLPTVRQLAQDAGINVMTVNKAYGVLKAEASLRLTDGTVPRCAPGRTLVVSTRRRLRLSWSF